MTQLSRERLEYYANNEPPFGYTGSDIQEMARRLLAAEAPEVPEEWRQSLQEMVTAMRHYEMDADEDAPGTHKAMMRRANALLSETPAAPVVPDDYQHLKNVNELYDSLNKRLFGLAQRIKGPSFDSYAYALSQAIDVLETEIFGEDKACRNAALDHVPQRAAVQPDFVIPEPATLTNISQLCPLDVNLSQTDFASGWNDCRKFALTQGRVPPIVKGVHAVAQGWNACRAAVLNQTHVKQPSGGALQLVGKVVARNHPNHERNVDFRWLDFNVEPGTKLYAIKQERG